MPDSPAVATEEPERGFEVRGRTPPGTHTLKLLAVPDHRPDRHLERRRRARPAAGRQPPAAADRDERSQPQPDPGHQPARRRQLLRRRHACACSLSDPLFFLIGYWYGDTALDVDGAAHQDVRQDAAPVGGLVRQGRVPARVHRAQQRTSACSPAPPGMSVAGVLRRQHQRARSSGSTSSAGSARPSRRRSTTCSASSRDYRTPLLIVSIVVFAVMMVNELRQTQGGGRRARGRHRRGAARARAARQLSGRGGSERCSTSSASSAHASGKAEPAPERLAVEVRPEPIAEVHRRARARATRRPPGRRRPPRARRPRRPPSRSATAACGSHPSGSSPRR